MKEKTPTKIPTVQEVMGKNLPEKKFRAGAVSATIWANTTTRDGKVATYNTISLERNYKDKNDTWQTTSTLRLGDVPKAILVLSKAYEHLALNDATDDD
ncbi:MAG: hypothetical protein V1725_02890 [archaeon]